MIAECDCHVIIREEVESKGSRLLTTESWPILQQEDGACAFQRKTQIRCYFLKAVFMHLKNVKTNNQMILTKQTP